MTTRHIVDDALKFWERRRLIYNSVLIIAVAIISFLEGGHWSLNAILGLVPHALVANLLYCTAYPVDLVLQHSSWRSSWLRLRWILWLLGTALALWLAILVTLTFIYWG